MVAYWVIDPVDRAVVRRLVDELDERVLPGELGLELGVHALDVGLAQGLGVLACGLKAIRSNTPSSCLVKR